GPRDTRNWPASSVSPSWAPGGREPFMIASRSWRAMIAAVDSRLTGSISAIATEQYPQVIGFGDVTGQPEAFPDRHLVGGEHRLAQPLLDRRDHAERTHRGVRDQHRVRGRMIVAHREFDDRIGG